MSEPLLHDLGDGPGAIIIGAGLSGLCMAIRLLEAGIPVVILEKSAAIGGTWAANRYPGCACDIPSHLYAYSFAPNPRWSKVWAGQAEILAYILDVVERYRLRPHIRLSTTAVGADYDEDGQRWCVRAADGRQWRARTLISAAGPLERPRFPDIPGRQTFAGPRMTCARWDPDIPLQGKRVGVIGSAASAIQMVPELAGTPAHLTVFQRTPNYLVPRANRHYTAPEKWLMAQVPGAARLKRWALYWRYEVVFHLAFTPQRWTAGLIERRLRRLIRASVSDPDLAEKVTPTYRVGCKRVLSTSAWLPALQRPDVSLITDPITAIDADGVRTAAGHHDLDVLIYATGFVIWNYDWMDRIRGRGGVSLGEVYASAPRAYLGLTVPQFPNFFALLGPNTGLGHNSVVWMVECQVNHIVTLMQQAEAAGIRALEVREDVLEDYDAHIHQRMQKRVWIQGRCASWYQHADGRIRTLWPDSTVAYWRTLRRPKLGDYQTR